MTHWDLSDTFETSAGRVSAGRAGDGPPLIVAHGWPWSSFSWHRVIQKLSESFTVHWYDMPGYGQLEMRADRRTSLDIQGQVFAEMLTHWGIERPRVIAHDFGGATTLRAHLLHGCDYHSWVLMNVVAMRPWGSEFFDHVGRYVEAFQGLPPYIHEAIVRAYISGALIAELGPNDMEQLVAPWLTMEGAASFYRQFAQADEVYTAEVEPMFGQLRCPTRVAWGVDDPWIPFERGKALAALIGQGDIVPMNGVGHLPQLEAPDTVLEAVLSFLEG